MHWTVKVREAPARGAAVTVGHEVYLFGGYSFGGYSSEPRKDHMEVYIFNTVSLRWRKLPPVTKKRKRGGNHLAFPGGWQRYTAVLVEDTIYIWGGWTNTDRCNLSEVLYAFDVNTHTWSKPRVSGTVPEGRYGYSACVLGTVMIIYGGRLEPTGDTNDIYKLDTTTMVWSLTNTRGTPPPALTYHSATIIGTKMFVFGGCGENYRFHKTIRVFDTETNRWMNTSPAKCRPLGRNCHSAFAYSGELYIFGGQSSKRKLQDLWKFNPETCSWKEVKPKGNGPLGMNLACCCMMGDRVILFGEHRTDDLFILDLSPSLKTLCKLAVIHYGLDQSKLPHNLRWELTAMNKE